MMNTTPPPLGFGELWSYAFGQYSGVFGNYSLAVLLLIAAFSWFIFIKYGLSIELLAVFLSLVLLAIMTVGLPLWVILLAVVFAAVMGMKIIRRFGEW